MNGPLRQRLVVEEKQVILEVSKSADYLSATYEPLRPRFASRFSAAHIRWVNSLRVSNYGCSNVATIYPYNTFDRSHPRLTLGLCEVLIGTEGWSIGQEYAGLSGTIQLETQEKAITGLLQRSCYRVSLSEPGHIAKHRTCRAGSAPPT